MTANGISAIRNVLEHDLESFGIQGVYTPEDAQAIVLDTRKGLLVTVAMETIEKAFSITGYTKLSEFGLPYDTQLDLLRQTLLIQETVS